MKPNLFLHKQTAALAAMALLFLLALASCGGDKKPADTTSDADTTNQAKPTADPKASSSVCVWDKVPVWAEPDAKSKYITALNMGESVTEDGDDKKVTENGKDVTYVPVALTGGKRGFVNETYLARKASALAITARVNIYDRPEMVAKTKLTLQPFDVVGLLDTKGDWFKVYGKVKFSEKESYLKEVWIKNKNFSTEEKDIAMAVNVKRALEMKDEAKRKEELQKIDTDPDLQGSALAGELDKLLGKGTDGYDPAAVADTVKAP